MHEEKILQIALLIFILSLFIPLVFWFSLDDYMRCRFLHHKNICNFYEALASKDLDRALELCRDMTNVPKKDNCFYAIATSIARKDLERAKEICGEIKEFGNLSKEFCVEEVYDIIQ